ncbi:putative spermidine/putrescine transport system permease protein [Nocardioides sp. BE266]|uniref:ABC transporter permease n=1 Tax=Nocardioides sp. BE266 TaxID=2817725 RepID=UPI0028642996|nr:ABC transporter permease [Nocardioides sp. BE266]MDR7251849.1 putative spermidine/putrescine transport system permease protein [Nocardioides sp. BE266]
MAEQRPPGGGGAALLHRHRGLRLGLLLGPPMLWLGVLYLGSLAALFITSLWTVDAFGGNIERIWNLDNYRDLFTLDVYRTITVRTLLTAVAVTVIDALLAFPIALYMAKVASPRLQRLLVIAVLTPLWASYLVKAYAWRGMFATGGPLDAVGISPGYGLAATILTLSYLWLPYMILPMYAGLERLPSSLIEASADLGASTATTMRRVVLPVLFPAAVAGSIFTFSLTLGDYIAVKIVGGANQMLGNVVYDSFLTGNNLPFAAAVATIPVAVMLVYLTAVRRTGALDSL